MIHVWGKEERFSNGKQRTCETCKVIMVFPKRGTAYYLMPNRVGSVEQAPACRPPFKPELVK